MNHLILSPHLDDAVLSCGGLIAELSMSYEHIAVLNLFSGYCPPPYSPWAQTLHAYWGNPVNITRLRRAEDKAAYAKLGVMVHCEEFHEAQYRRNKRGDWLYQDNAAMTGQIACDDESLVNDIYHKVDNYSNLPIQTIYAPLGIGNHVDHQIVFDVGLRLSEESVQVYFYEDFPYSLDSSAYRMKIEELLGWSSILVQLGNRSMFAKIDAFSYYRSQLPMLFGNERKMKLSMLTYANSVGKHSLTDYAERLWTPNKPKDGITIYNINQEGLKE